MKKVLKSSNKWVCFLIVILFLTSCSSETITDSLDEPTDTETSPTETPISPTATEEPVPTATAQPTEAEKLVPAPRRYHALAYDDESGRIIMVGGQSAFGGDISMMGKDNTWAYDSINNLWSWMNPVPEPTKLLGSQLAYDAESDRIILYGGSEGLGLMAVGVGDTWAYDTNNNSWEELSEGPLRRFGARLAYDSESDKIILFGGSDWGFVSGSQGDPSTSYNETWVYDTNTDSWINMQPDPSPSGRWYQPMAYDSKADRVILWGGTDHAGNPADEGIVWVYDYNTNTWEGITPSEGPNPDPDREGAGMVYDIESDRMIMFGGDAFGSETWAYDFNDNIWTLMDDGHGPAGALNLAFFGFVYDDYLDRVFLSGGNLCDKACDYQKGFWSYDFNTNTWALVMP